MAHDGLWQRKNVVKKHEKGVSESNFGRKLILIDVEWEFVNGIKRVFHAKNTSIS